MCKSVLAYMNICVLYTCLVPMESEEDTGFSEAEVMGAYDLLYGCCESILGLLQEQQVLNHLNKAIHLPPLKKTLCDF